MRFVITLDENGYELRYLDEVENKLSSPIVACWNKKKFASMLYRDEIFIDKKELQKAFNLLEEKSFVVFNCYEKENNRLHLMENEHFYIEA